VRQGADDGGTLQLVWCAEPAGMVSVTYAVPVLSPTADRQRADPTRIAVLAQQQLDNPPRLPPLCRQDRRHLPTLARAPCVRGMRSSRGARHEPAAATACDLRRTMPPHRAGYSSPRETRPAARTLLSDLQRPARVEAIRCALLLITVPTECLPPAPTSGGRMTARPSPARHWRNYGDDPTGRRVAPPPCQDGVSVAGEWPPFQAGPHPATPARRAPARRTAAGSGPVARTATPRRSR
jgi:hypothetical protein